MKRSATNTAGDTMWSTHSHFRQTRKGKILKSVKERYLRDDIFFGTQVSSSGGVDDVDIDGQPTAISTKNELMNVLHRPWFIIVVDTNVLLHNMDLLEHVTYRNACPNIVIPQTALLECKRNSMPIYTRTLDLLKDGKRCAIFFANEHHVDCQLSKEDEAALVTANDKNDACIRLVAEYFGSQLQENESDKVKVILLTDDADCRKRALEEQKERFNDKVYEPSSVKNHVKMLEKKDISISLQDFVAQLGATNPTNSSTTRALFPSHLKLSDIMLGVKGGKYYQGTLRCERGSHQKSYVNIWRGEDRVTVAIEGADDMNRAVDGDTVAIQLHSIDRWIIPALEVKVKDISSKVEIAADTAEPSIRDETNVEDTIHVPKLGASGEGSVRKPTGRVIGIIRRQFHRDFCGSIYTRQIENNDGEGDNEFKALFVSNIERDKIAKTHEFEFPDGTSSCVFFSTEKKIPPIIIRTTQQNRLIGKRILVSIDSWPIDSAYPLGHYVRTIGENGKKEVETEVLLHEHNIPCEPFSVKVMACLPQENYKIELAGSSDRKDLRGLPVLSIDPPGCKDIDDALHCIILENGNWQVGVHIADVTHYVEAGSPLDIEAANRSTSTYLVARRLDMLPSLLTTNLCSLKGNVDRFAFSVIWEVTPEGKILDVEFHKSIIHSIAALTYEQAQGLIDQPEENSSEIKCGAVKRLAAIARILRNKRIAAGALTLASPEVKFVLDSESLNPTDVQSYTLFEANSVVEEFMLLANVTVGKKILRHYPTLSVLRRHPAPNKSMFDDLISKARSRGFTISIDDSKRLADSLDVAYLESDPYFNKVLRILSTRCMSPAQYFCSGEYRPQDWHHYGLAAPVYTHFTSPIRRYADVIVHRLLAAAIGVAPLPVQLSSKSYLHDLAANMNRRHRSAQLAGRASVQLHTLIFFSGEAGGKDIEAYVLDVDTSENTKPSLRVIVPRYGIEGSVEVPVEVNDAKLTRDPVMHCIHYDNGEDKSVSTVRVFDQIKIKVWVRNLVDGKELVMDLVQPTFG